VTGIGEMTTMGCFTLVSTSFFSGDLVAICTKVMGPATLTPLEQIENGTKSISTNTCQTEHAKWDLACSFRQIGPACMPGPNQHKLKWPCKTSKYAPQRVGVMTKARVSKLDQVYI